MVNTQAKAISRWRFRFGLRSLFVAVCLAAVLFGWLGFRIRQSQLQRQALVQITALGGGAVCDVDFDDSTRSFMERRAPGMGLMDGDIPSEVGLFANVVAVDLSFMTHPPFTTPPEDTLVIAGVEMVAPITDDDLTCLAGIRYLRWLRLENSLVSDAGLRRLSSIQTLEWLNLRNTKVTDEGVEQLRSRLPHCEIVR